ncbi:diphosphate--fructose-6-phosphate 1-phosphotransferase [Olsenella sp. SW781]|uniref:diphosphate--fructose-6-phosphate 1-phosphotransferase n=1 Tax=Olsenella sp. SW781 TaxID=2530046 RepID=UPI001438C614|nr:diphosphate--fructose-6-phosphate 1-phosphotransferase [Olsenella sp. SW781]NJE80451.1 diphosphate--fructose-6-phosphate 1-phosphotransferase [Olsenella sp. SW781]
MAERCVLVGQSGGPTAAINASLAGVIAAGILEGARVEGMRYGIQGFLDGRSVRLDEAFVSRVDLDLLRNTPASWLGSCRFKLPALGTDDTVYQRLFERFEELGASAVLYIGGNDSMDTISKLAAYGQSTGSDIRFIGVPKTIDNDLVGTDHTPGYGSAARFVATAMNELAYDADVYNLKSVTFVEIMGRDAGWLTASSALAFVEPDLVLLPEVPLNEDALIERLSQALQKKNTVMVGVSEGVRTPDGALVCERAAAPGVGTDEFGHLAMLSGAGRYLAALTKERIGCKTRAVELSTLQRCASYVASRTDLNEAYDVGYAAVEAAFAGETAKMCAIERVSNDPYASRTKLVDVAAVANQVRNIPSEWISADGMGIGSELRAYIRPLIGELPAQLASLD